MASPAPSRARFGAASLDSGDELRENAYRLLERSYRRAEEKRPGSGLAVYRSSARLLRNACGERWVQATVFPEEARLASEFFRSTGLVSRESGRGTLRDSLLGNVWTRAWTPVLLQLERAAFSKVCRIRGAEHLRAAKSAGGGVILTHSHNLFSQLFWRWLEHEGVEPGVTLRQWTWGRKGSDAGDPKTTAIEGARELHSALATLRRGGMVNVLADGHQGGAHHVTVPFFNRERPFRRTFAELAVTSGAPVITVDFAMRGDGAIAMEIGAPMPENAGGGTTQERIDRLVRLYVDHLKRRWNMFPADIPWTQMRLHLKYPEV